MSFNSIHKLLILLAAMAVCSVIPLYAETEISGEVSGVWDREGSPYIVVDSTWVPEYEILRIEPGVTVMIEPEISIDIFGAIHVLGEEEDTIYFNSAENRFVQEGLHLWTQNTEHLFYYCHVRNIDYFIKMNTSIRITIGNSDMLSNKPINSSLPDVYSFGNLIEVYNSICVNNDRYPVFSSINSRFVGENSILIANCTNSIYCSGGFPSFNNCHIIGGIQDCELSQYTSCYLESNMDETGRWERGEFYIIGKGGSMIDCEVIGHVKGGIGSEQEISNCVINGNFNFDGYNGIVNNTEMYMIDSIDCSGTVNVEDSDIAFINCKVNTEHISYSRSEVRIDSCMLSCNLFISDNSEAFIRNNLIIGYIWFCYHVKSSFVNNTLCYPESEVTIHDAAVTISSDCYDISIWNNIFFSYPDSLRVFDLRNHLEEDLNISYNCFFNFDYWVGEHYEHEFRGLNETNIVADPCFVSTEPLDPHLIWNSPCIDAGDPDSPLDPDGTRTDIGAIAFDHRHYILRPSDNISIRGNININAYPNPFNNSLRISLSSTKQYPAHLELVDVMGRSIMSEWIHSVSTEPSLVTWDLSSLPSGNYILLFMMKQSTKAVQIHCLK